MMKVTANGKTFTFPDGTSTEDIGTAIDEYFAGQAVQQQTVNQANNAPTREEPSLMQQAGDWLTGGQSAGQIAEQAGRGLVNIPFDVLQGGASLINAISQGLGGPKVLDDVYRPVDRPTDPWAQAGETIGGYLLPIGTAAKVAGAPAKLAGDIGSAGNMIAGSLADAANQEGDFAENAAINAGLNIATHGLINGVTRGVRGASNIISGNKTSAQRATTAPTETSPFSGDAAEATNPAVHAAEARAAQGVPMTPATRNPEEVVRTVAAQKRPNLASSLDELDINPQAEVLESAERLNVDSLLPSHFSGNEQYKAVEQAIKSRTGSALQVQENEAIRQLAQGAGEIIDRVSGAKDALGMSDKFIDTVNGRMSALMKRSDQLYRNVEKAMPAGAKIDAPSTRSMLKQVAEDLGGMKNLDPIEKRVFRAVNPGKNGALTYANLNKQRRLVGDALHKNSGPYKDADRAALSRLYGSLADDQKAALSETNALRDFEVAQRLVQMRKSMEEQMINLTGRTLNGDVSRKATTALQAMSKGDAKGFRELMQNTPSRKLRTELLGTGLRDMLSNGKRGADFNPAGFADWYQNMLANGQMRNLARHLPKETMSGLNDVYKVAKAIKDAKSYEITTGRLNEFVKRFNRVTAANEFVANHAQRIGTAVGSTVSGPFSAVGAVAGSEIGAKVASKIRAMGGAESIESAEKLISSPEFQKAARLAVKQAPESIVDTTVRRSSAWRSFYNSLPESDKKTISRLGIMYWMNSDDNQK
ncbi:hypothetical protein [Escherichia coli]|uniref:hypothetical protein n=1 Tax=Escherichia coli TaxID=562 RepID=UPI002AB51321|nr:hypothetical protein [Escherichia coli]MDY7896850.1 hypothetical protein [Escherichia coli]